MLCNVRLKSCHSVRACTVGIRKEQRQIEIPILLRELVANQTQNICVSTWVWLIGNTNVGPRLSCISKNRRNQWFQDDPILLGILGDDEHVETHNASSNHEPVNISEVRAPFLKHSIK